MSNADNITTGKVVRIECELVRADVGEVIESSAKTGPVVYKHGSGQMLAALESQLEGMKVGEEKDGLIPAAEGFGTEDNQPTMTILRKEFPKDAKIEKGAQFEAKSPTGTPVTLKVKKVDDEQVVATVVHPLAGKDIKFKVKVLSVRPPPPPVPPKPVIEELDGAEIEEAPASVKDITTAETKDETKVAVKAESKDEAKAESKDDAKADDAKKD